MARWLGGRVARWPGGWVAGRLEPPPSHPVPPTDRKTPYVEFELFNNGFFTVGPLVLLHGTTGIPMGGFLGAQLTELWCIWREVTTM